MVANRPCPHCDRATRQEISGQVNANGSLCYGWWCLTCKGWTKRKDSNGVWISKNELASRGIDITALRVVRHMDQPRCARCGERAGEEHHWAPQALFGKEEADRWPKDFLCKSCHDEWHRLVTPQLVTGACRTGQHF